MTLRRAERWRVGATVLVLVALTVFVALRFRTRRGIEDLLPTPEDRRLAMVSAALAESALSRTMVLSLEGPTTKAVCDAAAGLAHALREEPAVEWVERGPGPAVGEAVQALYRPRGLHFLSDAPLEEARGELAAPRLAARARALVEALSLPTAAVMKGLAGEDPLLLFAARVRALEAVRPGALLVEDGQFVTADRRHAIVFVGTRASAFDAAAQAPLLADIGRVFDRLDAGQGGVLRLEMSGIHRIAVASEHGIRTDVTRISLLSTVGVVLLYVGVFRSVRLLFLSVVPLGAGLLAGAAAGLVVFGPLHGITLAFGATLIGVCIDYPTHLLIHHALVPSPGGVRESLRRVWPGLALGALTTVVGFAVFLWGSYPGLREIALVGVAGIAAALVTTCVLLPPLVPPEPAPSRVQRWAATGLVRAIDALSVRRRVLFVLVGGAVLLGALGVPRLRWVDDLSALHTVSPTLMAEDAAVRARIGASEGGPIVVALGADDESALRVNDEVARRLADAQARGLLGGFRSAHGLVWSAALQRRNLALVADTPAFAQRVEAALVAEGFRAEAFVPFAASVAAAPLPPLTVADLAASPLAGLVRPFRLVTRDGVGFVTFLRDVRAPDAVAAAVAPVDGAILFDQQAFLRRTASAYRRQTTGLFLVGVVAVFAMVALRYRRLRPSMIACLPAALAGFATMGVFGLAGTALNLLHLVGLVLLFSMGVDYGIFMAETVPDPAARGAVTLGVTIASLDTALGFGLLGISDNPALRAIGLTTGIGILVSAALAPVLLALIGARWRTP